MRSPFVNNTINSTGQIISNKFLKNAFIGVMGSPEFLSTKDIFKAFLPILCPVKESLDNKYTNGRTYNTELSSILNENNSLKRNTIIPNSPINK